MTKIIKANIKEIEQNNVIPFGIFTGKLSGKTAFLDKLAEVANNRIEALTHNYSKFSYDKFASDCDVSRATVINFLQRKSDSVKFDVIIKMFELLGLKLIFTTDYKFEIREKSTEQSTVKTTEQSTVKNTTESE